MKGSRSPGNSSRWTTKPGALWELVSAAAGKLWDAASPGWFCSVWFHDHLSTSQTHRHALTVRTGRVELRALQKKSWGSVPAAVVSTACLKLQGVEHI